MERHGAHRRRRGHELPGRHRRRRRRCWRGSPPPARCASTATAPACRGRALDAYIAAGVESDHEATRLEEAEEKRRKGMWVFLRQGSASQNLVDLAPTIVAHGTDLARLLHRRPRARHAAGARPRQRLRAPGGGERDLRDRRDPAGQHQPGPLPRLLGAGQPRARAIRPTSSPSTQLGPWVPDRVWQAGHLVARGGRIETGAVPAAPVPDLLRDTVNIGRLPSRRDLVLAAGARDAGARRRRGEPQPDDARARGRDRRGDDVAHAAVVERHHATGRIGRGFVTGFGLRRGAIASTVAHDAHNVVCIGAVGRGHGASPSRGSPSSGGGQVAVLDGRGRRRGGAPARRADERHGRRRGGGGPATRSARWRRGSSAVTVDEPFMQLSFIALSVIPAAATDRRRPRRRWSVRLRSGAGRLTFGHVDMERAVG